MTLKKKKRLEMTDDDRKEALSFNIGSVFYSPGYVFNRVQV